MLPLDSIIKIALRETDAPDAATYTAAVKKALDKPDEIPAFSLKSRPLDVVRFRCLLQDTGYPAEVYLPEGSASDAEVDWSKLQERWVGWASEIPGEQDWAKVGGSGTDVADALAELSLTATPSSSSNLPPPPKGRFPLAQEEYTGALLKIYDADAAFRPASAVEVIGIVSAAPLPAPFVGEDGTGEGDEVLVPAIHVLLQPTPAFPAEPSPTDVTGTRAALVTHLATAFEPADPVAAELLLLALIAHPTSRPGGLPLGTLALNLIRPATGATGALLPTLQELLPAVVPLDLTLPLLHSAAFRPSSDGTTLTPGTLQLAPDTLLLVDEDGLGTGGALAEKALRNVQALNDAIADQSLRYDYPYTDGVRIETALRAVLTSEGKSLLPADVHVPVTLASAPSASAEELTHLRAYLSAMGAPAHAEKLAVPDNVAQIIQDAFVEDRRASGSGSAEAVEERLRRRMKVARLMATSYPAAELTGEIWARTVALDAEVEARLKAREEKRREGRLGAPTEAAAVNGAVNGIAATEAAQ